MKLTEDKFREIINATLKKMLLENNDLEINEPAKEEPAQEKIEETLSTETLKEDDFDNVETTVTPAICDPMSSKFWNSTPSEVKSLNEQFKRMKQLVDFRSPLLIKD